MKKTFKILAIILVALIIGAVLLVIWAYKNPLAVYAWSTRAALEKGGLQQSAHGDLVYWEGGSGQELVFLHGAGDQAGAWAGVAPGFADRYHVVVLDLPGHGDSAPHDGMLKFDTILSGVTGFLNSRASDQPVILVGNSLGAWLSFLYARDHPDNVERIVAVNGGPLQGDPGGLTLTPKDRTEARKLIDALRDPASDPVPDFVLDDIIEHSASGPIGRMMLDLQGMVDNIMTDEELATLEVPVDLLWGQSDRLFPEEYVRRMHAALPRARLKWIPRCGHVPANECPELFLEKLRAVLDLEPAGDRS